MSSTKMVILLWTTSGRSFLEIIKGSGPPCGTPFVTLDHSEYKPFILTLCCLFDKKSMIQFKIIVEMP